MAPELNQLPDDERPELADADAQLASFRASIDNIDAAIIHMLAERFKITRRVGEYKRIHDLPPADPAREAEQIERLRALAQEADLDPEFGEAVIRFIISEVIRHHEKARS
jgi:chorismate mutase